MECMDKISAIRDTLKQRFENYMAQKSTDLLHRPPVKKEPSLNDMMQRVNLQVLIHGSRQRVLFHPIRIPYPPSLLLQQLLPIPHLLRMVQYRDRYALLLMTGRHLLMTRRPIGSPRIDYTDTTAK